MTDTNQASWLFELCKEVHEKTGWGEPSLPCWIDNATKKHAQQGYPKVTKYVGIRGKWEYGKQYGLYIMFPLYTSDYLLEKLPERILIDKQYRRWLSMDNLGSDGWQFSYRAERTAPIYASVADTPLKSLLLLTLKLHEEKLL